jgi:hypothetical protein
MLNSLPCKTMDKHYHLAEKLMSLHMEHSPYTKRFNYPFEAYKKGCGCGRCRSLNTRIKIERFLICDDCGYEEAIVSVVLRMIAEYHFLFPERKITTAEIYEWCAIISRKTIWGVLRRYFELKGKANNSHYEYR